jgi:4-hydroxy-2-oxoheptanedioate aldolase
MPRAVSSSPDGAADPGGSAASRPAGPDADGPDGSLRARLHAGPPMAATFVMMPRVEIVEIAAGSGFDAVVCDLEHGQVSAEDLPALHAAARAGGAYSLARVGSERPIEISRALDMGVDGVIVPHVASRQAAEQVAAAGRFPPDGERSLNPYVRGVGYGLREQGATSRANARTALIVMIEGDGALAAVTEIAAVPQIDALFVGPIDLAGSLGFPGQPEHPEVVETIRGLIRDLARSGVAVGIYAPTAQAARRWLAEGASLVVASADNAMTMRAFAAMRAAIADGADQPGQPAAAASTL